MKQCITCGEVKMDVKFHVHKGRGNALRGECKACHNLRSVRYAKENPDRIRKYQRKHRYGIEQGEYDTLFHAQRGCCAVCSQPYPVLDIDHNHSTGKIRGLLCRPCNQALGLLGESSRRLSAALKYLKSFE